MINTRRVALALFVFAILFYFFTVLLNPAHKPFFG